MTPNEYRKVKAGDAVVLLRPVENGYYRIPAATVMTVVAKYNGFSLRGAQCACCKVAPYVTRVPAHDVTRASPDADTR